MIINKNYSDARVNGVTITDSFISILQSGACLNTQHMLFFSNLFKKYYGNQRNVQFDLFQIFSVDCYFFADFMPQSTSQLPNDLIAMDKIQQIQNSLKQEEQKQQNQQLNIEKQDNQKPEQSIFEAQLIQPDFNFKGMEKEEQQPKKQEPKPIARKKNFDVKIVSISRIHYNPSEGNFRMNQMQQNLQSFAKINGLNQDKNPIYEYDYAFFPINITNAHWISFLVYLKEETIVYQDSLYCFNKNFYDGIKQILSFKQPKQIEWKLYTKTPQQSRSLDCGVFVLYSLFTMYTTGSVIKENSFSQSIISRVRQNLVNLTFEEIQGTLNANKIIQIINS